MVTWTPLSPYVLVHLFTSDLVIRHIRPEAGAGFASLTAMPQPVRHPRLVATLSWRVAGRSERGTLWRAVGSRVVIAGATSRVGGISRWLVELNDEA